MKIVPFLVTVLAALCASTLFVANGRADVDPAMVGTWETRGVNANGPWKLIWDIRQGGSYSLSGPVSDSGIIAIRRWQMAYAVQCGQANGPWDLLHDGREPHARNRSVGLGHLDAGGRQE